MMTTPDRESCHELTKTDRLRKKIQQNEEELFIVRYKYDGECKHTKDGSYNTTPTKSCYQAMNQKNLSPFHAIGSRNLKSRTGELHKYHTIGSRNWKSKKKGELHKIPQKNPQKGDDDLNVLPSMKLKSS